nr:MAG TPA: hypothetical protein [Bacteriophage sp.]
MPKLKNISQSFNSSVSDRIDLYNFINWEKFCANNGVINSIYSTLSFKKSISSENFTKLCNLIIKSKMTSISYLFSNCNLLEHYD